MPMVKSHISDVYEGVEQADPANPKNTVYTPYQQATPTAVAPHSGSSGYTPPAPAPFMGPAPPAPPKTDYIYAVNLATDPDWAALAAAGTGIVVASDDPDAARLAAQAQAYGVPLAVNIATFTGETPEAYAARVAAANNQYHPSRLVLDIEAPGYGYPPGDPRNDNANGTQADGWGWNTKAASLITQTSPNVALTVTTEPTKEDFNYGVWDKAGANFWIQSYHGDMSPVDPKQAMAWAIQSGVDPSKVSPLLAPSQQAGPNVGGHVEYFGTPSAGSGGTPAPAHGGVPVTGPPSHLPGEDAAAAAAGGVSSRGGTGGITSSGGAGSEANGQPDWAQVYFGQLGLPPDVISQVDQLFAKYPNDPQTAVLLAQQFIRTTPWFSATFPGFFNGLKAGLYADESGYRQYVNQVNNYSRQYFNRPVSTGEIEAYTTAGYDPNFVGKLYDQTLVQNTQGNEFNYEVSAFGTGAPLSASDLNALSGQQAGINSQIGARLMQRLTDAHTRMQGMFQGSLASPQLSLGNTGLNAPSLAGQRGGPPDIAA